MKRLILLLFLCLALLCGCASPARQLGAGYAPGEDKRLVVYTSHKEEIYKPILQEFEARTGIWVQVETGGTNEMLEQIALESDYPLGDLMFGGGVESLEAYSGYFTDFTPEGMDKIRDGYYLPGSKWLPFSSLPIVLIYNPKLVGEGIPQGWNDLLMDRWKGRIAFARPEVSGSSYTALATLLQALPMQKDEILRRFFANLDGKILSGSGDVVGAVADGDFSIGVTLEETAQKGIAAGADIAMAYPQEGTSDVPDGAAIIKGCAHEENAKRFISFILGADVQKRLITDYFRRSVRGDLADPNAQDQGLILMDYDIRWAGREKSAILSLWGELSKEAAP